MRKETKRENKNKKEQIHCYTDNLNEALSLYKVLEVTLYFSKSFLEFATILAFVVVECFSL